jgi:dipeptidyl aminopeptidase/acylaminoacyl peptidase
MRRREFLALACASARAQSASGSLGSLAYVQTDGLWVRDLPDGAPRKLVGSAVENPRFSPSGDWIAYDGGVIRAAGGPALKLPKGSTWLSNRDALAIATNDGVALFDAPNWTTPRLTRKGAEGAVFSPDGSQFVYEAEVEKGKGPGGEPMRDGQLRCERVAGGSPEILASQYLMGFEPFAWTRDSRFILYWEDPDFSASVQADGLELFRVPAAGGKGQRLGVGSLVHHDLLSLAPGDNLLAVTTGGGRETWTGKRIAVVNLDNLSRRYLTGNGVAALAPAWSPDGTQVAYSAAKDAGQIGGGTEAKAALAQRRIWAVNTAGPLSPRQLTSDRRYRDEEPLWSADGRHILFCRMDTAGAASLWLMGATGDHPVQVSGPLALKGLASADTWFGFYGYIDWRTTFDWHRPTG